MRHARFLPAALVLLLAACGGAEGDADATETTEAATPTEAIGDGEATASATDEGDATSPGTLDEIMNEPELYTDGTVTVTAVVSSAIEGANAWILEAGGEDVLLVGPADSDVELTEGDSVLFEGEFKEFNPAEVGQIDAVVDGAAITQAFDGEYVVVANSLELAGS